MHFAWRAAIALLSGIGAGLLGFWVVWMTITQTGHNPGMHEFAQRLIASGDTDARARLTEKFPTGALAVIDFAVDDWRKLHPRSGRLDRLVVPRTRESSTRTTRSPCSR